MRFSQSVGLSIAATVLLAGSCATEPEPEPEARDVSPHRVGDLYVNSLRIQYLDWGGTGDPIVFVHGAGDSPHYFDDIAPGLVRDHRVYALARRGHGQSEVPTAPFSIDDLAADVRQALEHLRLEKATLVGFSFGGNEITRVAELFPQRVDRLIYLDAALERSTPAQAAVFDSLPPSSSPTPTDLSSLDSFRTFVQRIWYPRVAWSPTMETVFRDITRVSADGSVTIPSDSVAPSLAAIRATYRRQYSALKQPVLAIFPERYELLDDASGAQTIALMAQWHSTMFLPYQRSVIEQLQRDIPSVRIVRVAGIGHNALPVVARDRLIAELVQFTEPRVAREE